MRTLELRDNELYLDGERLSYLTDFNISYSTGSATEPTDCTLYATGIVFDDEGNAIEKHGDHVHYSIDERVKLKSNPKEIYVFADVNSKPYDKGYAEGYQKGLENAMDTAIKNIEVQNGEFITRYTKEYATAETWAQQDERGWD